MHDLRGFPKDKMLVIPNGIDEKALFPNNKARRLMREALGLEPEERVFLYVSRLDPMKGHKRLIESATLTPSIKYIFVGKGTETLDVPSNIICLGHREDLISLYNAADWLISWSNYGEGFPTLLLKQWLVVCLFLQMMWVIAGSFLVIPALNPRQIVRSKLL